MRWTVRSALLFLAFGALVLGALNLAARIPISGPTPPQRMKSAFDRIAGAEAVSLGGSIGTAVDFEAMCVDGAPFWNNGQDLFETEALVELILARPDDAPPIFFLAISPTTLGHDNGLAALAGTYRRRFTYRFLHGEGRWGLIDGDWRQALLSEAMPAIGHQLREPWHGALLRATGRLPPPDPAIQADTRSVDPTTVDRLATAQVALWREAAEDAAYFDPGTTDRSRAALLRIADRIDRAGAQLVIVVPPYVDQLRQQVDASEWANVDGFASILERVAADGAIVLDHWIDDSTSYEYKDFRDAMHLNSRGASRFSRRLANELRKRDVVPFPDCR